MIEHTTRQLQLGFIILSIIVLTGTIGYSLIERWGILDSFYMTIITISTTGFMEVAPLSPVGRILTTGLIIAGVVTIAYTAGRAAQLLVETQILRRRRMSKKIKEFRSHYVVCGFGRMGKNICEELFSAKVPFVVIEKDESKVELISDLNYPFVLGDATLDEVLIKAGVRRAKGLVAVLPSDAENVFATLSAKVLNPDIFVVARAVEEETESKLVKAGANRVVNPYEIGGMRMAQVLLRPAVMDFIDVVARHRGIELSMEEIRVASESVLIGTTLAESPIRRDLNIIVVAIFRKDGRLIYNPVSSTTIQKDDRLIAIGEDANLMKLTTLCVGNQK